MHKSKQLRAWYTRSHTIGYAEYWFKLTYIHIVRILANAPELVLIAWCKADWVWSVLFRSELNSRRETRALYMRQKKETRKTWDACHVYVELSRRWRNSKNTVDADALCYRLKLELQPMFALVICAHVSHHERKGGYKRRSQMRVLWDAWVVDDMDK